MAHYAFLDDNNLVVEVIVGIDETELIEEMEPESWYSNFRGLVCKRTSYNNNIRKNFAGIGYTYSEELDAFIPPQPYDSWSLNEDSCQWECPVEYPNDGLDYKWNEDLLDWEITDLSGSEI